MRCLRILIGLIGVLTVQSNAAAAGLGPQPSKLSAL